MICRFEFRPAALMLLAMLLATAPSGARGAAPCSFADQGDGHVSDIVDGRSFHLADGREIKLAGIEPVIPQAKGADRAAALSALLRDRDVMLRGPDDTPDRYGRQSAFVFLAPDDTLVQALLLAQGEALVSTEVTDKDCEAALLAVEAEARAARRGTWASPSVIKNAERPGDILAGIGRFTVVEGRVLSVRQAGATTYLNFGRNWIRGFAATISKRMMPAFASSGIVLKSLENRRIQVRGWVEGGLGPRIRITRVGQIEVLENHPTRNAE
jgi:endonuclease YncB( thermonuclease family)